MAGSEGELNHRVVTKRDHRYPFKPYWACLCGTRFFAQVMGPELYREFARHQEEEKQ